MLAHVKKRSATALSTHDARGEGRHPPMPDTNPDPPRSPTLDRNVAAIHQLEQQALGRRSFVGRWSGAIGRFTGSGHFILAQGLMFATWIWLNRSGSTLAFDPYPHSWLMLVLALEAIFISAFVLISQRQMQERADTRAHVNLQFNLLVEAEITKLLTMMQALRADLGAADADDDEELRDLATRTEVQHVVEALEGPTSE